LVPAGVPLQGGGAPVSAATQVPHAHAELQLWDTQLSHAAAAASVVHGGEAARQDGHAGSSAHAVFWLQQFVSMHASHAGTPVASPPQVAPLLELVVEVMDPLELVVEVMTPLELELVPTTPPVPAAPPVPGPPPPSLPPGSMG
jgi:hypothetical protein